MCLNDSPQPASTSTAVTRQPWPARWRAWRPCPQATSSTCAPAPRRAPNRMIHGDGSRASEFDKAAPRRLRRACATSAVVGKAHRLAHIAHRVFCLGTCARRSRRRRCCAPASGRRGRAARARASAPALPAWLRSPAACSRGSRCLRCGSRAAPTTGSSLLEYTMCSCHTGQFSGSPGSLRRTRAGSVGMRADLLRHRLRLLAQLIVLP